MRVTPAMVAAAWTVVRGRYPAGRLMGPGPGFAEAIQAALDAAEPGPADTLLAHRGRILEAITIAQTGAGQPGDWAEFRSSIQDLLRKIEEKSS